MKEKTLKKIICGIVLISSALHASEGNGLIKYEDLYEAGNYATMEIVSGFGSQLAASGIFGTSIQNTPMGYAFGQNIILKYIAAVVLASENKSSHQSLVGKPLNTLHARNKTIGTRLSAVMVGLPTFAALSYGAAASFQEDTQQSQELYRAATVHAVCAAYNGASILGTFLYERLRINKLIVAARRS